ncbi:MAG: exodeoxyribonuclease VII small subunit [Gemmatimonadetes bacterium]|nr:MAG: exodeoxyribonuclease VII small subunit [Gemmatimonadota bacterium]PYP93150.1 MAG: exodeoxyribonuclease VII small subunit [Gemmatimonadota bacterium]
MARARGGEGEGGEVLTFTQQLDRLEEIVRRLEAQELDLDEALKLFEEGIERLREARDRLTAAEAQVKQVLADRAGNLKVEDFDG